MKKYLILLSFLSLRFLSHAQQNMSWHQPAFTEGVCVSDSSDIFGRLPAYMQQQVRKPVWDLSKNTAGEFLHFKTTARSVTVKYVLAGKSFSMPHMPATGVSGVDLYAMDMNGSWNWSPPHYSFGDTCIFTYKNLQVAANNPMADFYLYLPLYNTVRWLSIGVSKDAQFKFAAARIEKPIVAYGTSILQGAVASRPGLAWTNILERNLDREVINLGFSGNGRFEKPVFDLMAKTDAALYILDCMPNLTKGYGISDKEIKDRVYYGIKKLRGNQRNTPIILTEHADGYTPFNMDTSLLKTYHDASLLIAKVYEDLKNDGFKNIYLLTDKEIGFDINSTTEGTHANDIGMMKYAMAYEKLIRQILKEPSGSISTEMPVPQSRDGYDWIKRHDDVIAEIIKTNPEVMLFGNSIVNYWGGRPKADNGVARGETAWQQYMQPLKVQNAGFGWDRIENVLWRVYHGELDPFEGKKIVVMIGTNNLQFNTDNEIVEGLRLLMQQIHIRKPGAQITMIGILPRKGIEQRVKAINRQIQKMTLENHFLYADFGKDFLNGNVVNPGLFMSDGLHPNADGYNVLGRLLSKLLKE